MDQTTPPVKPTPPKSTRNRFSIVALCCAVIALVVSLLTFFSWQHAQVSFSNTANQTQLELQAQIQAQATLLNQQHNAINTLQLNLSNSMRAAAYSKRDRVLHEISYQLHFAKLRLDLFFDSNTALALLSRAETKLRDLDDSSLFTLEQSLKTALKNLQANRQESSLSIVQQLDQLNHAIQQLPSVPQKIQIQAKVPKSTPAARSFKEHLNNFWQGLKSLVIIRKRQQPQAALLSDTALYLLKQQISLQLSMAQWAALQHNQAVYSQALQQVSRKLQLQFPMSRTNSALIRQSAKLATIKLTPEPASIDLSIHIIDTLLNNTTQPLKPPAKALQTPKPKVQAGRPAKPEKPKASTPGLTPKLGVEI